MAVKKTTKRIKRTVQEGVACIQASYNNTIVTITDESGDVLSWASAGGCGFRGSRKSTPYAAQVAAEKAIEKAKLFGLEKVSVRVKGVGLGREQAIRGLYGAGVDISAIIDVTPVPHNGCRQARVRRV